MRSPIIRRKPLALLALPLLLFSTSCGHRQTPPPDPSLSRPDEARLAVVAAPGIPAPSVPCSHNAAVLCNTDADNAAVLAGYDAALAEANRRICWLKAWFGYAPC